MPKGQNVTTLVIHVCPKVHQPHVTDLLAGFGLVGDWVSQALVSDSVTLTVTAKIASLQVEDLVAELAQFGLAHFELNQHNSSGGVLFMFVPGLGIYRGEINQAGSLVLAEEKLESMLSAANGNHREFTRLLRLAFGQSWDDILEPLRAARYSDNLVLLNRAG